MVNASLAYEILMYINSFYFGLYAFVELSVLISKGFAIYSMNLGRLQLDMGIFIATMILEAIRIYLGRKSSLSKQGWQVIASVFLTIPCIAGMIFLVGWQFKILNTERILSALMLTLQSVELLCATVFLFSTCRPKTYT